MWLRVESLLGMVIWYDILFAINMLSEKLQSKFMCINSLIKQIKSVLLVFEKYRNEGFTSSMNVTKSVTLEMDVELGWKNSVS